MAKSKSEILEDKISLVFDTLGDLQKKLETKEQKAVIEQPKVSPIRKHFDAIIENALQSPHTTLSGLAVIGCSVGAKLFPAYASTLSELQVYATGLTGVTAGNAIISKQPTTEVKPVAPAPKQNEEYG